VAVAAAVAHAAAAQQPEGGQRDRAIPDDYICPLSLQLMTDPVRRPSLPQCLSMQEKQEPWRMALPAVTDCMSRMAKTPNPLASPSNPRWAPSPSNSATRA
jgi:U-box domain